jgi:hypothetical protein
MIGEMARSLPPSHHPPERPLAVAPRVIELCFQTAGVWEIVVQGRFGLPQHIDRVRLWRPPEQAETLYAVVTPDADGGRFDAEVFDAAGNRYVELTGYHTIALAGAPDARPARTLQAVA